MQAPASGRGPVPHWPGPPPPQYWFAPEHEPESGDTLRLGIAPARIHLFDLQTRRAIEAAS